MHPYHLVYLSPLYQGQMEDGSTSLQVHQSILESNPEGRTAQEK